MCAEFMRLRDVMIASLINIKCFSCKKPKAAFYVFRNISQTGWSSQKLAEAQLETTIAYIVPSCLGGAAITVHDPIVEHVFEEGLRTLKGMAQIVVGIDNITTTNANKYRIPCTLPVDVPIEATD